MPETRWNDDAEFERLVAPGRDALDRLVAASRQLQQERRHLPAAESQAMSERAEGSELTGKPPWDENPAAAAHETAGVVIVGAEDHATALVRLLRDPIAPLFAHIVLARACLEHAAKAWWMLDPTIGVRLRIARGLNERLYSFAEVARLPLSDETRETAKERALALVAQAEGHSFRKLPAKRREPATLEERRPTQSDIVGQLLKAGDDETLGRVTYRFYSAVAHGSVFGLLQSASRTAPGLPQTPGTTWAAFATNSADVNNLLSGVIMGLGAAYNRRVELFGWTTQDWNQTWLDVFHAAKPAAS